MFMDIPKRWHKGTTPGSSADFVETAEVDTPHVAR